MRGTLFALSALFLAVLTLMLGSGLLGSLLSLRLTLMGYGSGITGMVMSGYYAGLVGGSFVAPAIVRRAGHIRAFAAFAAVNTIVVLLHSLFPEALAWGLLRLVNGLSMMGLYMVVESWLNERADSSIRGRVFSVYMTTTFLGLGAGQFLLRANGQGQTLFTIAAILFAASLIPVTLTRAVHPQPVKNVRVRIGRLIKVAPFGVWGCLGAGLANGAFYSLGPAFGIHEGLSVDQVAWLMGVTILSGLVLQWPVGMLSDRFDRLRMLGALSFAVAAASGAIIVIGGSPLLALLIAAAIFGGLTFTTYPVAVAHANDHIDAGEVVPASAALILSYGVGAAVGPMGAAWTMAAIGPRGLFLFIAVISCAVGIAVFVAPRRAPVPPEEQAPFVAMPRTSAVIAQLDPRAEVEPEVHVQEET
ncbi:MAG TPA: MFS transporter [Gammaproteobacteria bacterium]|jgi:MFS family permease|nr:MFS transporter [Gammaproteobacteria bacterium]